MNEKMVFAIFDVKAKFYMRPFLMRTRGEALRGFSDLANDEKTEIGRHPEDFVLFYLAKFDEEKGLYTNNPSPESLGLAIEFVKEQEK